MTRYDSIGHGYATVRKPDPRIASQINAALEDCRTIVNVGAGTADPIRKRTVIFTFDTSVGGFWLTDYFPEMIEIDAKAMPSISELRQHTGAIDVIDVPIPHDCIDGFWGAYWRRPEAYLQAEVRNGISLFSNLVHLESGVEQLRADLESGAWRERYASVLEKHELELGYRLLVA